MITNPSQYLSAKDRPHLIKSKPNSGLVLGLENFGKEFVSIFKDMGSSFYKSGNKLDSFPEILGLKLTNVAVKNAEIRREMNGNRVEAHPISRSLYDVGCFLLDNFFDNRPIERFWFLETVARIPYFVYVSMLHLYESLGESCAQYILILHLSCAYDATFSGWWREPSLRKIHNAEEWNELHHLLIMEALGGDKVPVAAQHLSSLAYLTPPRLTCRGGSTGSSASTRDWCTTGC